MPVILIATRGNEYSYPIGETRETRGEHLAMKQLQNFLPGLIIVLFTSSFFASESATVFQDNEERDCAQRLAIAKEFPDLIDFDSVGFPEGTTKQYLITPPYITDVIRIHDTTVGFINYAAYNKTSVTPPQERCGIINIMGIQRLHQGKRYGEQLIRHAIKQLHELKVPCIKLGVRCDNTNAQKLYNKVGFSEKSTYTFKNTPYFLYQLSLDIPDDQLSPENLVQLNKKTTTLVAAATLGGLPW